MPTKPPTHRPLGWKPAEKRPQPGHGYYKTQEWVRLSASIRERDRYTCQKCGDPGRIVDHRIPRELGGSDHPSNLWTLCPTCDNRKHREKGRARR